MINEGGLQSIPKTVFPGGALIGCSAGFLNVPKIKGTHLAMKSGMVAAECAYDAIFPSIASSPSTSSESESTTEEGTQEVLSMDTFEPAWRSSWIHPDLHEVRNFHPSFSTPLGIWGGMAYSGTDALFLRGRTPWTFRNRKKLTDAQRTKKAAECKPIEYPAFQPPLSTDLMTSVALTGTNHAEDQPVHLRVMTGAESDKAHSAGEVERESEERRKEHVRVNVGEYAGLLGRACPAGVYEYVDAGEGEAGSVGGKKLVINSQVSRACVSWTFRFRHCLRGLSISFGTTFVLCG